MATDPIITPAEYEAILRQDFPAFIQRCFHEVNPQTRFRWNWHIEVLAAKLDEIRRGNITRLIINIPPRHLKSLCASIALPAWCLGHDPAAQVLCVSYAQPLGQAVPQFTCHHERGVVSAPLSDPFSCRPAINAGICDHGSRLPARHLGRRRTD